MSQPFGPVFAQPFFLPALPGERFCLYHGPAPDQPCRGALLYVHPFGEEMNKSRRMAALQARALARIGFAVLQVDLYGCGDSSGDFGQARWDIWRSDLRLAKDWLEQRAGMAADLWGLRLGALLALDFACLDEARPRRLLLWQPVLEGSAYLTQVLRMRLTHDLLVNPDAAGSGTAALRQALRDGHSLEIGGYELAPALADAIEGCDAAAMAPAGLALHWFELMPQAGRAMPARRLGVLNGWRASGVDAQLHQLAGPPFWASQEIAECPALLSATAAALLARSDAARLDMP